MTQDQREDCYVATLHINQVDVQDSRPYYLVVENERGADRHSVALKVEGLFPGKCARFARIILNENEKKKKRRGQAIVTEAAERRGARCN